MPGISIGASKSTTGLMAGVEQDSFQGTVGNVNTTSNKNRGKSWIGQSETTATSANPPSMASRMASSFSVPKSKRDVALSVATSMASSAASATAGAIVTGAKAGAKAAKAAAVNRANPNNGNNNNDNSNTASSMWKRMSWSKPNNSNADESTSEIPKAEDSAAPSWTETSSGRAMGGNSDYGVSDHLPNTRQSFSSTWKSNLSTPRIFTRRMTSPEIIVGEEKGDIPSPRLANVSHLSMYGGLLSRPPSTITFVILRKERPTSAAHTVTNANIKSSRKELRELLGVGLVKSQQTNHRFQVVREDSWGDDEEECVETDSPDAASSEKDENSSVEPLSPLLPPQLTVLLRPGDYLESVDGIVVGGRRRSILTMGKNRCWDEEGLYRMILTGKQSSTNNNGQKIGEEESTATGAAEPVSSKAQETLDDSVNSSTCSGNYSTTTLTFVCGEVTAPPSESTASSKDPATMDSLDASAASSTPETTSSETMADVDASSEEKESSSEAPTKTTVVTSPADTVSLPTVHKAYFVNQNGGDERNSFEDGILDNFLTLETVEKSIIEPPKASRFGIGNKNNNSKSPTNNKVGNSLLHINSIPENHWLGKQKKIKAGDVLLCADDTPCYNGELSPGDLSMVWRTALLHKVVATSRGTPYVGITTCSIPPTRMESIRKTAVAATGGALVSTGAVLMVTPLHPVGHAMAIGGLGVLGTEFEAPKKAFEKAKQSAANLAARVKKQPSQSEDGITTNGSDKNSVDNQPATSKSESFGTDEESEDQFISS